jgi:hypothetical protein
VPLETHGELDDDHAEQVGQDLAEHDVGRVLAASLRGFHHPEADQRAPSKTNALSAVAMENG